MAFCIGQTAFTPHGWQAEARVKACWSQGAFTEVQTLHVFLKIASAVRSWLPFPSPSPWGEAEAYLKTNKSQSLQGVNIFHKCQRRKAGVPGAWHAVTGSSRRAGGERCASSLCHRHWGVPGLHLSIPGHPCPGSTHGAAAGMGAELPAPSPAAPCLHPSPPKRSPCLCPPPLPSFFGQGLI